MQHNYRAEAGPSAGLLRAATWLVPAVGPVEGMDERQLRDFLRSVWDCPDTREALSLASSHLAAEVGKLITGDGPLTSRRALTRAASSVRNYLLRAESRPTPFGLFAGVNTVSCGPPIARFGTQHVVLARPSAAWLDALIHGIEQGPLVRGLPVTVNSTAFTRGSRLILPYQPEQGSAAEVSVRCTAPVRVVLGHALEPIPLSDLHGKLAAEFPTSSRAQIEGLLRDLIGRGVLLSALHAPSTEPFALGRIIDVLAGQAGTEATELTNQLRAIDSALAAASGPVHRTRTAREHAVRLMREVAEIDAPPLAVDTRLDADVRLPLPVWSAAGEAADLLGALSPEPYGTPAMKAWHQRFYERFGIGSLVPVLDVVADSGIGWPDGYPGAPEARRPAVSARDRRLVALAQQAALKDRTEVVLDDDLLAELSATDYPRRLPPHLDLGFRLHATSVDAIGRGRFTLEVVSVGRGAGVLGGRFLPVLDDAGGDALSRALATLPTADDGSIAVQLSVPPLRPETAHVNRAPGILPLQVSIGEHRRRGDPVLTLADIAVGCDGRRMYLAAPRLGKRLDIVGFTALNLHLHTPPLARLLLEISRAQNTVVTQLDWGAACTDMPFLPRLRRGNVVLSAARWQLAASDLPPVGSCPTTWDEALLHLCQELRVPGRVRLREGDKHLPLDLDLPGHRELLRRRLARHGRAVLVEDGWPRDWIDSRPHEVVLPVKLAEQGRPAWPRLPEPRPERILPRGHGDTPAHSRVVLASIYGDLRRQDEILAEHLPALLRTTDAPWWYVRYRDPDQHLRLRFGLQTGGPGEYGVIAGKISAWAADLQTAGLVREIRLSASYPEHGRWGSGAAWEAAEDVFRTDSDAVLTQLRQPHRPNRRSLVVAHNIAIAAGFLGSTRSAMTWLLTNIPHRPPTAATAVDRSAFADAVRLADPTDDWVNLRATDAGTAIRAAWAGRDRALDRYRSRFPTSDTVGVDPDDVLQSLLHVHFVRAFAVDFAEEDVCLHLTRAAAHAWSARNGAA
ncbi:lantibiotic dehydratase [Actinacidiphila paucisporea]|uniref:Thiopeptide-type bacteriocin biosynthesis domain-containing protein n=1 Tax=Actinacidiphila paucisporea TaxID=310782 RepID=A0A1M6YJI8_9ACTN|nr:lantibiotic dehydratase [Actinacidiphila paucisporea]SHL18484.1 thiopeptide-type bacteriocin biosynthesis domain-containing protein [Actinacidiphila paucisporea]